MFLEREGRETRKSANPSMRGTAHVVIKSSREGDDCWLSPSFVWTCVHNGINTG